MEFEYQVQVQIKPYIYIAFLQVKDHKEGFPQRVEYRLLNPSKSSIGALSKKFLDMINNQIR